jgi:hypothetical protein
MTTSTRPTIVRWPAETEPLFHAAITVDYASRTAAGTPVTAPVTPFVGDNRATLDVSTGLTYPTKAERARRDPRVSLLYADAQGSGVADAPVVLVQGFATVRDADLQTGTDRYVRLSSAKFPHSFNGLPDVIARRMAWYFARIWVEVTPTRVLWWPHGDLDAPPEVWEDSTDRPVPTSDPAPRPRSSARPRTSDKNRDWRDVADTSVEGFPHRSITTLDGNGHPLIVPVRSARLVDDGIAIEVPVGASGLVNPGPASLAVHTHDETFSYQRNATFVGNLGDRYILHVDRALDALEVPPQGLRRLATMWSWQRRYAPRLAEEAARRGQPVPVVSTELLTRGR